MFKFRSENLLQFFIIFISFATFTLKYTLYWSFLGLFLIIVFIYLFKHKFKLKLFRTFLFIIPVYIIFLIKGIGNPAFLQDFRINFIWLFSLLIFYQFAKRNENSATLINIVFIVNVYIVIIYSLFYFKIIPNFYETEKLAAYQDYRIIGPALCPTFILPFLYAVYNRKRDKVYYINFFIGLVAVLLNGSLQYLSTFIIIYFISYIQLNNLNKILKVFGGIVILSFILFPIAKNSLSEKKLSKINELTKPLESKTVQTRINDFKYIYPKAADNMNHILLGHGVGVNSVIFRENKDYPSLSKYRTFLEIDNGFFYIFHRFGVVGLFIVILLHVNVLFKKINIKTKLIFIIFFLISNLLSYHYWGNVSAPFFIAIIIDRLKKSNF